MKLHGRVAKGIPDCVRGAAWKLMANADQVQAASKLSYPVCISWQKYYLKMLL